MYDFRRFTFWYITLAVIVAAIFFFTSHSIVKVDVQGKSPIIYLDKQGGGERQVLSNGWHIVSTGRYFLRAYSGNASVARNVSMRPVYTPKITGNIEPQKQTTHVAQSTEECVFGDITAMRQGTVLSYECGLPQGIYKNIYTDHSIKTLLYSVTAEQPTPYKDGIVGLYSGEEALYLSYYGETPTPPVDISEYIGLEIKNNQLVVRNNIIYIFNMTKKRVYIFETPSSTPKIISLQGKSTNDINSQSNFAVTSTGFIISSPKGTAEDADSSESSQVVTYSKTGSTLSTQNFNGFVFMQELTGQYYYSKDLSGKITVFEKKGTAFKAYDTIDNTEESTVLGDRLVVTIKGYVYTYQPATKSLHLLFQSTNVKINHLTPITGKLVLTGYSVNESSPSQQVYIVEASDQPENKVRLEDKLPYGDKNSDAASMDYLDQRMYVAIELLNSRYDPTVGQVVVNEVELREKKKSIEDQLKQDGLLNKYVITYFTY